MTKVRAWAASFPQVEGGMDDSRKSLYEEPAPERDRA